MLVETQQEQLRTETVLLGMNFLDKLEGYAITKEYLIIELDNQTYKIPRINLPLKEITKEL